MDWGTKEVPNLTLLLFGDAVAKGGEGLINEVLKLADAIIFSLDLKFVREREREREMREEWIGVGV